MKAKKVANMTQDLVIDMPIRIRVDNNEDLERVKKIMATAMWGIRYALSEKLKEANDVTLYDSWEATFPDPVPTNA